MEPLKNADLYLLAWKNTHRGHLSEEANYEPLHYIHFYK